MRFAIIFFSMTATAQITSMQWGAGSSYSYQFTGINGAPNNGRYTHHDTTRATWCDDDKTYLSGNDGFGPQYILVEGVGRNAFFNSISDFTVPLAGVLETLINSMDSFGHAATDVYSNGTTLKTSGTLCFHGKVIWVFYQQFSAENDQWGSSIIYQWSTDHGATWCGSQHTNPTTGVCTITPSATGDLPLVTDTMFDPSLKIVHFMQYCKDSNGCSVVDKNDLYQYGFVVTEFATHVYTFRVLNSDFLKFDGTLYHYYKGGDGLQDSAWDVLSNALPQEVGIYIGAVADVADPIYIPNIHAYVTLFGGGGDSSGHAGYYQAPKPWGPWTSILEFDVSDESWNTPVLKSFTSNVNTATIQYLTTFGPPEQDTSNKQLNLYNPIFHVAKFFGPIKSMFPMPGGVPLTLDK